VIAFQSVFPSYRGGISKFSDHLYKALSERYLVRAFNYKKLYPPVLFPGTSQYLEESHELYAHPTLHAYNPLNWKSAYRRMIHAETQVYVYSHWHPFFTASQISILKEIKTRNPDVVTAGIIHNVSPHERFPMQDVLTRRLFKLTDAPIVLSEQTNLEYLGLMSGERPERLFHPVYEQSWPDDSRESIRKRFDFEPNEIVVLFFGLVRQYKGLDILIDALNLINLEKTRIRPLIVGEFYIDPQSILSKIKTEHLPYYEIVNRYVSEDEAARYLSASDVMVLPYRSASQSGVLSNALNFNLPALVSDLPGLTELVKQNVTGRIVEPGNSVALARELVHLATEANLSEMRTNVESYRQRLSWTRFVDEFADIVNIS
jgi:glycosyltransferase involved in cell wall biosynthesis